MTNSVLSMILSAVVLMGFAACATPDGSFDATRMDCFESNRIIGWESHDGRTLDVTDMRGDHFRVHFCNACPGLRNIVSPSFEGGVNGLMCGNQGETVSIRGASCRISSVMRVSPQAEELDVTSCD